MDGKVPYFSVERMAVAFCLFHSLFEGQNNVSELCIARGEVYIVHAVLAKRERQNVCLPVNVSVCFIKFTNLFIVDNFHGHFRFILKVFHNEHCGTAAADEKTESFGYFHSFLVVGNNYFYFACHRAFLLALFPVAIYLLFLFAASRVCFSAYLSYALTISCTR